MSADEVNGRDGASPSIRSELLDQKVAEVVAAAPVLTAEQRDRLCALLREAA